MNIVYQIVLIENNMLTLLENRKTTAKIIKDMHEVDYNIHDFLFIAELEDFISLTTSFISLISS